MGEREALEQAIATLEEQRSHLGDGTVDQAVAGLRERLAALRPARTAVSTPDLAEERKLVTVLFADLTGFTALSEKLDAEEVRTITNDCFTALVPLVEQFGGTVDKFIGDEIMALFGAPVAHENDAERALQAALKMVKALERFNADRGTDLGMHFGVETGTVVAGGLGSERHHQYSVLGDSVNLASRLAGASERGQILVGATAHRLTSGVFEFEARPPLSLKGKSGLVPVFRLLRPKTTPDRRDLSGVRSPMVGRDSEFGCLTNAVRGLSKGKGEVIALTGEAGLGKSRLVAEARDALAGQVRWAEGRALSYAEGVSYGVVQSLIDSLLEIGPDASAAESGVAFRSAIDSLLPERCQAIYPYLALLCDVPLDPETEEQLRHVVPEAVQARIHRAFNEMVRALCAGRPVVLVWEDLHWADPSSLGLLESLLPLTDEVPLLVLLVFRPNEGRAMAWFERIVGADADRGQVVELAPLTGSESGQLVENLLKIENMPPATRELILSKAEGNPFFLEELVRSLIDAGMVVRRGNRVVATPAIDRLQVPDTLQGAIAARIDRLPAEEKHTLQDASVIGRVFQKFVLARVLDGDGDGSHLDECLTDLERRELIRHRLADLEYIFKHALTQDVAYQSLLVARRRELHRMTAEAIEALFPDDVDELCETLAYHYQQAQATEPAIRYLTRAAERARATFSNAEAIGFCRAALEQASAAAWETRAQLHESLADVLALTGRVEEARGSYEEALAFVPLEHTVWRSRLYRKSGNTWMTVRQQEKALPLIAAAEDALGPAPCDPSHPLRMKEWLAIQLDRAWAYYWLDDVEALTQLVAVLRPAIEKEGGPAERVGFFRTMLLAAWRRDRYHMTDETLGLAHEGMRAAVDAGGKRDIASWHECLGMCHMWREELAEGEEHLREAWTIAQEIGSLEDEVLSLTYLTVTYRGMKDVAQVRRLAAECMETARGKMDFYVGSAEANLAWADWSEGKLAEAREHTEAAFALWGGTPNPVVYLGAWPALAVAWSDGRDADAVEFARKLVVRPCRRMPPVLESSVQSAVDAWERGETKRVRALLGRSIKLAQQSGWL